MATVKADFDLYLCAQGCKMTDEYYKIFTSTVDTINANGGNTGLHAPLCLQEVLRTLEGKGGEGIGDGAGRADAGRA